jgi:imidazolonepropionase-like amidohydrolase
MGLDGMKLFTGVYMGVNPVLNMDVGIARAAVDVAHAEGNPEFAHPQNRTGVETAIAAGVDILAHITPDETFTSEQLARFKSQGIALVPTLSVYLITIGAKTVAARIVDSGVSQLKAFSENGGPVLFGTDVGFMNLYDTALEYELHRALSERQVLASLTTNPARYFNAAKKGMVRKEFDADLVVLDGDPVADIRNLAKVAYTIRAGKIIYRKP